MRCRVILAKPIITWHFFLFLFERLFAKIKREVKKHAS